MLKQQNSSMTDTSNLLSIRDDRPLDPWTAEILQAIDRPLQKLECPYMLVGAMARDLLLVHVFGMKVMRATRDLDFAIAVESWERFSVVKQRILEIEWFTASPKTEHRIFFQAPNMEYPTPVDIIPFGGVANAENEIECRS
jgi:predicted nucleotidyltransferase